VVNRPTKEPPDRLDVTVVFLDGSFSSTAVGPLEVFHHAGVIWNLLTGQAVAPRFRVTSASLTGEAVACQGPLTIQPAAAISDIRKADLIFIPSSGLELDTVVTRNARIIPWLRRWHGRGAAIAGVCAGVGLVAAAGLLDGKRATTHWGLAERFRREYPRVRWMPEQLVTEDGDIYCGGGVHASLDLSLYLVEKFCGHETAAQCARALLIDSPRSSQSDYAVVPLRTRHQDEDIARAQDWLHEHFRKEFRLEDLAARVRMSPRNFARRFRTATGDTPLGYLQKLRIAAARRLLEAAGRTVQEVGSAVGYEDTAFFRSLFRRHTGVAPQAYRERFGRPLAC
jgi:transcriptional regulator GlxA family with amidase domain